MARSNILGNKTFPGHDLKLPVMTLITFYIIKTLQKEK